MLNTAELYSGKTDLAAITPLDTIFAEYRSKKDSIEKENGPLNPVNHNRHDLYSAVRNHNISGREIFCKDPT